MGRVEEYRRNAQECRALPAAMPDPWRDQMVQMAKAWEDIAREREQQLADAEAD